jgi:hypothetical protein
VSGVDGRRGILAWKVRLGREDVCGTYRTSFNFYLLDPRGAGGKQQHNLMEMVFAALCAIIGGAIRWTDVEGFVESALD